jgi:hypothetical protein
VFGGRRRLVAFGEDARGDAASCRRLYDGNRWEIAIVVVVGGGDSAANARPRKGEKES